MSSSSTVQSCIICNKKNAQYCARCRCTSYCSKACQKEDWKTHKLLCASFSSFATSRRPTTDHYRAILFDPKKRKPEFTWLLCKWHNNHHEGGCYQAPETDTIIGNDALEKNEPIQYNSRLKRSLSNTIFISYRDTFLIDGSHSNKSIASITATQPGEYHDWRGPIVVHARLGEGLDQPACKDIDLVDFRHVADYFLSYGYIPPKAQAKVKGVRINCVGDVKMFKRPPFEQVEVPTTDVIFTMHDTSDIANRIGIPILTRRCPPDPE